MKKGRISKPIYNELQHLKEWFTNYVMDFFDDPIYGDAKNAKNSIAAILMLRPAALIDYLGYVIIIVYSRLIPSIKYLVRLLGRKLEMVIIRSRKDWKYKSESVQLYPFKSKQTILE